jgi:multimeric flavodoxin WrbA
MKVACISAANIECARGHSASVRACELVREQILEAHPGAQVEIIPLIDYDLVPCRMCGGCVKTERCAHDHGFNQVFEKMIAADGMIVVVPHYAPLPSKLMILFEKIEEIAYLKWCQDQAYHFPLASKAAGVIGHGGQETSDQVLAYYKRVLVEPVAAALCSVGMRVIGAGDDCPSGVAFGIRSLSKRDESIFVDIQHDWDDVRKRIAPLVKQFGAALSDA